MVTPQEKREFVVRMAEAWVHSMKKIPLDYILPQAALESGWGTSAVFKACNNLFGTKGAHFGQGLCTSHLPPASEGPELYTRFDTLVDCLNGYMRKVTHPGNRFFPCYLAGQTRGRMAFWRCLARLGWAGKKNMAIYGRKIAAVAKTTDVLLQEYREGQE